MATINSILNQIYTEAREGPSLGSIDRCTPSELIEARDQFPNQFPKRSRRYTVEELRELDTDPELIFVDAKSDK